MSTLFDFSLMGFLLGIWLYVLWRLIDSVGDKAQGKLRRAHERRVDRINEERQ